MPKRKADTDEGEEPAKKATKADRATGEAFLQEVWNIKLDDDEYDSWGNIRIYDDCNDIRRKLNAFLKKYHSEGVTQTALLRLLNVNSNSFGRYMKLKGPCSGAENNMYKAGYEFFEKLRVYEKKPKSAKRLSSEKDFAGGLEQKDASKMKYYAPIDFPGFTQKEVMLSRARDRAKKEKAAHASQ